MNQFLLLSLSIHSHFLEAGTRGTSTRGSNSIGASYCRNIALGGLLALRQVHLSECFRPREVQLDSLQCRSADGPLPEAL
jgi:hypothetical protein